MGVNKLVYHGSNTKFNEFATKFIGTAHGIDAGFGFYFTESKSEALTFGKYVYTCFLNLKREVSLYQRTIDDTILRKVISIIEDMDNSFSVLDDFESIFEALEYYAAYPTDVEIIKNLIVRTNDVNIVLEALIQCEYVYTTDRTSPDDDTITHYIVYDINCITINKCEAPLGLEDLSVDAPKAAVNPLLESQRLTQQYQRMGIINQNYVPKQRTTQQLDDYYQCSDSTEFYNEIDSDIDFSDIEANSLMDDDGKAKSKSQRRLFYMALAYKNGSLDNKYASDKVKKLSQLSDETLHEYANTKQKKRKKDGSIGKRNAIPQKVKSKK